MNILIAGAGPVGLTAAIELTQRGLRPRIVDRNSGPSPESRAVAINARSLELLEPSGAADLLIARGHRVRRVLIQEGGAKLFTINVEHLPHRFNFITTLAQSDTERALEETLARLGGRVERDTELKAITADGAGFRCDGAPADILIGADGAHSTVRHWLGLGFPGESAPGEFELADVELDAWPHPWDHLVGTLQDEFAVGFIPLRQGFGRFVSTVPDLMNRLPPGAKAAKVLWQAKFRINFRQAETYQKGNAFLAGDAAHIHSPVGGRGMNLGIEDASWLAWLIAGNRAAEYTALRHAPGQLVLRQTAGTTRLTGRRGLLQRLLLRQALPWLLAVPGIERRLLARLGGLDTPRAAWLR